MIDYSIIAARIDEIAYAFNECDEYEQVEFLNKLAFELERPSELLIHKLHEIYKLHERLKEVK